MRRESKIKDKRKMYSQKYVEALRIWESAKKAGTPDIVLTDLAAVANHSLGVEKALEWVLGELQDI